MKVPGKSLRSAVVFVGIFATAAALTVAAPAPPARAVTTISSPTVGRNLDGRLEAFVSTGDGSIWHIAQTCAGCGWWPSWASLGNPGQRIHDPVVARNADGRLEVFAITDEGMVYHAWQTCAGCGWTGWAAFDAGPPVLSVGSRIAVGENQGSRLEIFVETWDCSVWHNWQLSPNGTWSGWAPLGSGSSCSGTSVPFPPPDFGPAVARNPDGRLEVFAPGGNGNTYHAWQSAGGAWSGWYNLGGSNVSLGSVTVGQNLDGRLEGFAVSASNGAMYHDWQPNWSGARLGGTFNYTANMLTFANVPAVSENSDGRLEVFAVGPGTAMFHAWQDAAAPGGWSAFYSIHGSFLNGDIPAVAENVTGRLEVFAVSSDTVSLLHAWQNPAAPGGWSGWASLGSP